MTVPRSYFRRNRPNHSISEFSEKVKALGEKLAAKAETDKGFKATVKKLFAAIRSFLSELSDFFKKNPVENDTIRRNIEALSDSFETQAELYFGALETASRNRAAAITREMSEETENTADDGGVRKQLRGYSDAQKNNWRSSKKIVIYEDDEQLIQFANDAIKGKNLSQKMYLGIVSGELADFIKTKTGLDLNGRNVTLRAGNIRKIALHSHGDQVKENNRGQRAVDATDFAKVPRVIESPDHLERSQLDYKGRPAVQFEKTIDNSRITVIAVDSGGSLDLFVQTMYIGTKKESVANVTNAKALIITPETSVGTALNNSISDPDGNVKTQNAEIRRQTRDAEYLDLAKDPEKNAKRLQEMVDEAAKEAMPNSKLVLGNGKLRTFYHGTNSSDFSVFDTKRIGSANDRGWYGKGFYFAFTKGEAGYYGENVISAYLNVSKPWVFADEMMSFDNQDTNINGDLSAFAINLTEKFPDLAKEETIDVVTEWDFDGYGKNKTLTLSEYAKEVMDAYNSDELKIVLVGDAYRGDYYCYKYGERYFLSRYNTKESAEKHRLDNASYYVNEVLYRDADVHMPEKYMQYGLGEKITEILISRGYDGILQSEDGDEAVVFNSSQIKSADPVTYDDEGNIIPLSERFNKANPDIRRQARGWSKKVDRFKKSDYNDVRLGKAEYARVHREAMTWHAQKINERFIVPGGAYNYICEFDERHNLTIIGMIEAVNIHEKEECKNAYRDAKGYDSVVSIIEHKRDRDRNGKRGTADGRASSADDRFSDRPQGGQGEGNGERRADLYDHADGAEEGEEGRIKRQAREIETAYDKMGESARLAAENEKLRDDIDELNRLVSLLKWDSEAKEGKFATKSSVGAVASELLDAAGVPHVKNKSELMTLLLSDGHSFANTTTEDLQFFQKGV